MWAVYFVELNVPNCQSLRAFAFQIKQEPNVSDTVPAELKQNDESQNLSVLPRPQGILPKLSVVQHTFLRCNSGCRQAL